MGFVGDEQVDWLVLLHQRSATIYTILHKVYVTTYEVATFDHSLIGVFY
jgi:hypothetical protein